MATMKAVFHTASGGPEVLTVGEIEKPSPRPRDIIVRLKAVAVNPVDGKIRRGASPTTKVVIGYDGAGVVESVGSEATWFKPGDEVYFAGDRTRNGCNAEYVAVDERIAALKPTSLSWEHAAGLPLVSITGWEALFEHLDLPESSTPTGKSILIVGGSGGTGSVGIQFAKKVAGLTVYASAGRDESREYVKQLGADFVVDHRQDLAEQIPGGVDYVYTTVDVDKNFDQLTKVVKPLGKIVSINYPNVPLNVAPLFLKRATLAFEYMFMRSKENLEPEKQGALLKRVAELIDAGVLRHTVTKVYPSLWESIREVHADILSGNNMGKTSLLVP